MQRFRFSWDMAMWVVAVAALGLSIFNWAEASRPADVRLVLASQVRLTVGPDAQVYLQPVFVSTAANDRAEVVDGVSAEMTTPDGARTSLVWTESGTFEIGPFPDYVVDWRITTLRPEPIVVTASTPQTPILRFRTATAFDWVPGTYRVDLRATRLVADGPLTSALEFDLTAEDVAALVSEGPRRFLAFGARIVRP